MKLYDSFHGVGGFRYGLEQAGMECVGGCEIDKYACQAYGVINDEDCRPTDIRTVDPIRLPYFDIFVGGFPCQDLSVAGKRKGFDGERSVLFFEILRICEVKRPTYILLENVTGLFSHNGGETFRIVLQSLDELGYDAEWQVHNSAAYVPQNRERVFIIGHLRGRGTRPVFPFGIENTNFVRSVGNTNPSGNGMNGQVYDSEHLAPTLTTNKGEGNKILVNVSQITGVNEIQNATCLDANYFKGLGCDQARAGVLEPVAVLTPDREEKRQNGRRFKEPGEPMFTLTAQDKHGVAILQTGRGFNEGGLHEVCPTITKNSWEHNNHLVQDYRIRKLTPLECFRLQSFPDWWYYKLKEHGISDSQLYKMAGNAVTSEVARQIGIRLMRSETA